MCVKRLKDVKGFPLRGKQRPCSVAPVVRWGRQVPLWLLTGADWFLFCFSIRPAAQWRITNGVSSAPDAPTPRNPRTSLTGSSRSLGLFLPLVVLDGTSGSHHRPSGVIKKTWWFFFPRAPSDSASREGVAQENGVFGRRLHHAAVRVTDVRPSVTQDPISSAGAAEGLLSFPWKISQLPCLH